MVPRVGHSWIFIQFEFVEHKPSDDSPVPVCLANCSDKPRLTLQPEAFGNISTKLSYRGPMVYHKIIPLVTRPN